jgi:hypothetical protein
MYVVASGYEVLVSIKCRDGFDHFSRQPALSELQVEHKLITLLLDVPLSTEVQVESPVSTFGLNQHVLT